MAGEGWLATLECVTLATGETAAGKSVTLARTASKGIFSITSQDKIQSYVVYDVTGKLVKKSSKMNSAQEKLDLSTYPSGTYVVSVTTEKETVTKKVIK